MFHLHEKRRRRICRAVFIACCLAPTCMAFGWAIAVHLPQYKSAHERALAERLGVAVSIGRVASPRPGRLLYSDVELADRETGERLARARLVEAWRENDLWNVRASQPELTERGLTAIRPWLERELHNLSASDPRTRFEALEATLALPGGEQSLVEVIGQIDRVEQGPQAKISFCLAGPDPLQPAELMITRNRTANPPESRLDLHTGEAALPCRMLSAFWPALARLGQRAAMHGSFWISDSPGGAQGEAFGDISNIDLASLVDEQFPHRLSGASATLTLAGARFVHGRLEQAAGSLSAGPGEASRSLLTAAEGSLHLVRAADPVSAGQQFTYQELALSFVINAQGLVIRGSCQKPTEGRDVVAQGSVLTADRAGTILKEPLEETQPVVNLVRTLVPQNDVQVPATVETSELTRFLPIPAVKRAAAAPPAVHKLRVGATR